jgi:hypothetical protein
MAAPLAVLSNTHHTSSAGEIVRTLAASAAIFFSSYRDQYFRGDRKSVGVLSRHFA